MAITPNTNLRLLKCPIEVDNRNQIDFTSATAQYNYFNSLPKLSVDDDDFSYQRKDSVIAYPDHIDNIMEYNYCMYQNENYSNKWFYAFITDMKYENDGLTYITIKTDVYQTWLFDLTFKASFIEREHVDDDTIGKHTIPENLNVSEVIQDGYYEDPEYSRSSGFYIGIQTDWEIKEGVNGGSLIDTDNGKQFAGIAVYDSVVYGSEIALIKIEGISDFGNLIRFIARTNLDRHIEDIHNIFIVPNVAIDTTALISHSSYAGSSEAPFTWYTLPPNTEPKPFTTTITKPSSFTGITIKNNKCFTYPYCYLLVSNNNGNNNIYKYENFISTDAVFYNQFALTIGGSGRITPLAYKGAVTNDDEALPLGKYPTCAWSSDAFTNWLTQNSVNIATQIVTTGAGLALAGATGGASIPAMSALSSMTPQEQNQALSQYSSGINTATQIAGIIGSFYEASLLPNIQGGQATGDIMWRCK